MSTRRKTLCEVKIELESKFPHLEVLSTSFINNKTPLEILDKDANKIFYRSFNRVMTSNSAGHKDNQTNRMKQTFLKKYGVDNPRKNKIVQEKTKATCIKRYGVENPSQVKEFSEKASKSMNNAYPIPHWKTGEILNCVGKYEAYTIKYLNENKINYIWKPLVFTCANGRKYFPDLYLIDRDLYVEVKGRFFDDAKLKWDEFQQAYPNSELWSKKELALLGITDKTMQYPRKKK